MTREYKMTLKPVGADFCDIYCEVRDESDVWEVQGVIPTMGTVEQVKAQRIAYMEQLGWTLCDMEQDNVVTFWKEV